MAGYGPAPLPGKVAKIRGTYRKDRHEARATLGEPPGDLSASKAPKHLTQREAAIWEATVRDAPWLKPVDANLLASYCQVVADIEALSGARLAGDVTPESEKALAAAQRQLMALANALSLTPSQRGGCS